MRAVVESAGIENILTKCLGSRNPHNLIKATINGLRQLKTPDEISAQTRENRSGDLVTEFRMIPRNRDSRPAGQGTEHGREKDSKSP